MKFKINMNNQVFHQAQHPEDVPLMFGLSLGAFFLFPTKYDLLWISVKMTLFFFFFSLMKLDETGWIFWISTISYKK